jgi:hypothetical protein
MMAQKGFPIVVSFSDPSGGEVGQIYSAVNFSYTGLTKGTQCFKSPDGKRHDSRQISGLTRDRRNGQLRYKRSRAEQRKPLIEQGCKFEKLGLLSLKHARGQIDADAIQREGNRLLWDLQQALETSRVRLHENLAACLKEYFDPSSGKLQERVERLIKQDGELEQVLRRQVAGTDSEMAKALATHVGEHSPLMKVLDPSESTGIVQKLRESVNEALQFEREYILSEFSLDNKNGSLNRLVAEVTQKSGDLQRSLAERIEEVVGEFSLDDDSSALSRLVKKVENAQQTISQEFSLDNEGSALSRMSQVMKKATEAIDNNLTLDKEQSALARLRRELVDVLNRHEQQANAFQSEVKTTLAGISAKREEASRSTTHGREFEDLVWEFVQREAQRAGDIPECTANSSGFIRHCKVGDCLITLGEDCAAMGEKLVVEAKEDASYDLTKAREEMETARKNRKASSGVFVFSAKTAPDGQEPLLRYGSDVFIKWDAEDLGTDVYLKAAIMLAKALCVRQAKVRDEELADFEVLDKAILEVERQSKRLEDIKKWTETIQGNSPKVLNEVRKMDEGLEAQIEVLYESTKELRGALASFRPIA